LKRRRSKKQNPSSLPEHKRGSHQWSLWPSKTWRGRRWKLTISDKSLILKTRKVKRTFTPDQVKSLRIGRGFLGCPCLRENEKRVARLPGLTHEHKKNLRKGLRLLALAPELEQAKRWSELVRGTLNTAEKAQRWIPNETVVSLKSKRPPAYLKKKLGSSKVQLLLDSEMRGLTKFLNINVKKRVRSTNERIFTKELSSQRDFLNSIEKSPLTEEQARSVICYDNRAQVVAAAGSGKTSVMVARAGYALKKGFTSPNKILLLAFNKAAADELQERVYDRLRTAGIPPEGVTAKTFHSFGSKVIGKATGEIPTVAPWVADGRSEREIDKIVKELKDQDSDFAKAWDIYRLLFAIAPTEGPSAGSPDKRDRDTKRKGFETFKDETVKSEGERMIANWLFLHGVDYRYEERYRFDTASASHPQYHPDFYYPEIDIWHEHWALDRDGKPPKEFVGYEDGMRWKRSTHYKNQTTLIETTWAGIMWGNDFNSLEYDLKENGASFNWDPQRATPKKNVIEDADLCRLIQTFMTHVKSNSLTKKGIQKLLEGRMSHLSGTRTQLFLRIFWPIHDEWNCRLATNNYIDFEDMLVNAAEHLEKQEAIYDYDLILVDEFQDASHARARLVKGLLQQPNRHLLAVGDDWQSINRFAGADISVMTKFEDWFGESLQTQLTRTFRCTQEIADVSSHFITKNPRQIKKKVVSAPSNDPVPDLPIELIEVDRGNSRAESKNFLSRAVAEYLDDLSERLSIEHETEKIFSKPTVFILGRYNFDSDSVPSDLPENLSIEFRTVHTSKGLEADYVLIPKMSAGTYGFPSGITDDPVLNLAMASADEFEHAEERRLFYVALTRARLQVALFSPKDLPSPFIAELLADGKLEVKGSKIIPCPKCGNGVLVERPGRNGIFLSCSVFACDYTQNPPRTGPTCDLCGLGTMEHNIDGYWQYLRCSRFPECHHTLDL
jgi:DNA helicase IV